MEQTKPPPRCGHIGALSFTRVTSNGSMCASRPIHCRADAAFIVDGQHYRCGDHLVSLLSAETGTAREVLRLDAPIVDLDAVLTAAGAQCTLDRFQEEHATTASRIELVAAQRDRLDEAFDWLDADPGRLSILATERERQITEIRSQVRLWHLDDDSGLSLDDRVAMRVPSVRQVLASMLEPASIDREKKRAEHEAAMDRISALGSELDAIDERTEPRPDPDDVVVLDGPSDRADVPIERPDVNVRSPTHDRRLEALAQSVGP